MSPIIISILVVVCIFAGGLIGLSLNRVLRPSSVVVIPALLANSANSKWR